MQTMWTDDAIAKFKAENGVDKVFVLSDELDAGRYDAIGFERGGSFWLGKGSVVNRIDTRMFNDCWEFDLRVELADDGYIQRGLLTRNENLLNKGSALKFVLSDSSACDRRWVEK